MSGYLQILKEAAGEEVELTVAERVLAAVAEKGVSTSPTHPSIRL